MHKKHDSASRIFEIATAQQGYFTHQQAVNAGYGNSAAVFHVNTGNWIRERRGIYRLAQFPPQDRPDLVLWALWSANRKGVIQGVYSHETALSIYELTDVMPAKFHMMVPKLFRKNSTIPPNIVFHRGDLAPQDIRNMQGYLVTTPARTIADMLAAESMHPGDIMVAFKQATKSGLITQEEARHIHFPKNSHDN
jgi:predicted transcriptional regulator of viral defense system